MPGLELQDNEGGIYRAFDHEVVVEARPTAIFSSGKVVSPVRATVCGSCGYVLFFARDHRELWRAHREAQRGRARGDGLER